MFQMLARNLITVHVKTRATNCNKRWEKGHGVRSKLIFVSNMRTGYLCAIKRSIIAHRYYKILKES
uniref:Uncharacterized protein n=1 Tax=Anguilla anguilla TaxID=7936 RepID=A0A0E9UGN7_ANGAN